MKVSNSAGPMPLPLSVKAWTLFWITPERVRNVPNTDSKKVSVTRAMFQFLSNPRRACNMIECKNAVAANQGIRLAFSTGSHAQ